MQYGTEGSKRTNYKFVRQSVQWVSTCATLHRLGRVKQATITAKAQTPACYLKQKEGDDSEREISKLSTVSWRVLNRRKPKQKVPYVKQSTTHPTTPCFCHSWGFLFQEQQKQ